ncbi:MAG: FABP family protein, partial [Acidimicrobiales bacterium]
LEVASFSHVGKPFIAYVQRTRDAIDGSPLHSETGYLRPVGDGQAEFVIAQPTGIVEMLDVEISGTALLMSSAQVFGTPTAMSVDAVRRQVSVARNEMTYAVQMAAEGTSMSPHLEAVLSRG